MALQHYGNGATEWQHGHGLWKRLRKWIRINGNVMLETRSYSEIADLFVVPTYI